MQKAPSSNYFFSFFCLFFVLSLNTKATDRVSTVDNIKFSYSPYYGNYIARPEPMLPFDKTPYLGQELKVGYQTDGKQYWHQALNYPYYGLGLYTGNYLDNYQGSLFGGFFFIDIPIFTFGKSSVETSLGMGVTLNCNNYDIPDHPTFMQGSSYANVYSHISLGYLYSINDHYNIGCGVRFQHFSNGGWQYPNNGLEMPSVEIKIQFSPEKIVKKINKIAPKTGKHPFTICYVAGISGSDVELEEKFFNTTLSLSYNVIKKPCYALSGGIDATAKGCINKNKSHSNISNLSIYSNGIYISNELIAGKCSMGIQIGTYLYSKTDYSLPIYERLTLRYLFVNNTFLHFGIKLNGGKSEFLEWGIGYKL